MLKLLKNNKYRNVQDLDLDPFFFKSQFLYYIFIQDYLGLWINWNMCLWGYHEHGWKLH